MPDVLFVYGSLRSEFDNPYAQFLRETAELLGRAAVRGSIFPIGRYPGYRNEPHGTVHGELWRLRDPEATLSALDEYESFDYQRAIVPVIEGSVSEAWIYVYIGDVQDDRRILTGDFPAR